MNVKYNKMNIFYYFSLLVLIGLIGCGNKKTNANNPNISSQNVDSFLYSIEDTSGYYFEIVLYTKGDQITKSTLFCFDKSNNYLGYSHVDGFNNWAGLRIKDTLEVACDYIFDEQIVKDVDWKSSIIFERNRTKLIWVFRDKIRLQKEGSRIQYYLPDSCTLSLRKWE